MKRVENSERGWTEGNQQLACAVSCPSIIGFHWWALAHGGRSRGESGDSAAPLDHLDPPGRLFSACTPEGGPSAARWGLVFQPEGVDSKRV